MIIEWEQNNYDSFPWRETDNDFHALIAELMLQRTRANQVVTIYNEFTSRYPTLKAAVKAEKNEMRDILSHLGLNWRIEKIIQLIEELKKYKLVPDKYEELVKLPGVGDYVASAYLSLHRDKYRSIIDANAVRLWGRLFGFQTGPETRRKKKFKTLVDRITPTKNCRLFNLGVLDLSRKACKTKPLHMKCPFIHICNHYQVKTDELV